MAWISRWQALAVAAVDREMRHPLGIPIVREWHRLIGMAFAAAEAGVELGIHEDEINAYPAVMMALVVMPIKVDDSGMWFKWAGAKCRIVRQRRAH